MMTRAVLPFYRSDLTRWSFVAFGIVAGFALSPLSFDPWRDTPSLDLVRAVTGSWWVVSGLFAVYVALLVWGDVRAAIAADVLGIILYGFGFFALLVTLRTGNPTNPLAICGVGLAVVLHYHAARLALIDYRTRG